MLTCSFYSRLSFLWIVDDSLILWFSIRFAPPLVISEEDLKKALKVIAECLDDLDKV